MTPPPVYGLKARSAGETGGGVSVRIAAIIPARMASTRFPNKPLFQIEGLPMIEHVRRRTELCEEFSDVVVATCDEEIAGVVESFGGRVIMTSAKHQVATERVIEAMEKLDCTHVINVQGDEVLILPSDLEKMVAAIQASPSMPAWNAVAKIERADELEHNSIVKCVLSRSGKFLYCSRDFSSLPFKQNMDFEPIYWVIGILGYARLFLEHFRTLSRSPLEKMESIEQLRLLENDISITSVRFEKAYPGINEPREVAVVKNYLREDPLQREIFERIQK